MSLNLKMGTEPHGLYTKAMDDWVIIGNYCLSLVDFLALARYVLENSRLTKNDPRTKFVNNVKNSHVINGWRGQGQRLELG